ncbi:MAG: hypothetical protein RRA94_03135 [Bacteroidota bacterium]|nr:hypothetical protein [Bacteroidota bacterium]
MELEYDIALLSPMAYDVFLAGSTIQVHWVPREGYRAPDSVVIELRAYGGTEVVISSRPIPFNDGAVQYTLPDDVPERFFLRVRGSKHECADYVSPLFASFISVELTSPATNTTFLRGETVPIRWSLHFPADSVQLPSYDTGTVRIEYRLLSPPGEWTHVAEVRATHGAYDWKLPDQVTSTFELRAKSNHQSDWVSVGPIQFQKYDLLLLSPKQGEVYPLGRTLPVRWSSSTSIPDQEKITVYSYHYYGGGHLEKVGSYPYSDGGIDWMLPADVPLRWKIRIIHEASGAQAEVSIESAELKLLHFPSGGTLPRGSVLDLEATFRHSLYTANPPTHLLSTDGGRTWPYSGGMNALLVDYPVSNDCRLRLVQEDISFEDTSATFAITESLETIPFLRVGEQYSYKCTLVEWRVVAGGTVRIPRDLPGVHISVQDREVIGNKAVYHILCWQEGQTDNIPATVEETLADLHPVRGDRRGRAFPIPFDYPGLFVNLDSGTQRFAYTRDRSKVVISRDRGLESFTYYSGSYPAMDEYIFVLR